MDNNIITISTPPRAAPARLPIRTPDRPRPRRSLSPEDSPELLRAPPVSTAPPKLEEGRSKRKRKHTARYKTAVEDGLLAAAQRGALSRGGQTTP